MTELIDSLNNNFRYETDQMTIHKESFDITETLKQLRRTIQYDKLEIINELTEQNFMAINYILNV